jgi:large subunit ribosomal protein L33
MHPSAVLQMARGKGKTVPIKVCDRVLTASVFSFSCHLIASSFLLSLQLLSSAGTGYFYTTRRNVTRTPDKFKFVKFDPIVRRRVLFTEHKIK